MLASGRATMQAHSYPTWKQVMLFGVLGPPLGVLFSLLWIHVAGDPPSRMELGWWLPILFPAAYIYAGAPALVTGYAAASARTVATDSKWAGVAFRFLVPVMLGVCTSLLSFMVTLGAEPSAAIGAAGAFAAFLCTLLVEWRARLRTKK